MAEKTADPGQKGTSSDAAEKIIREDKSAKDKQARQNDKKS